MAVNPGVERRIRVQLGRDNSIYKEKKMNQPIQDPSVTSDDRLWSALGYPIAIIPIIVLLMEDKKNRPFMKFHAIQSLLFNVALWVIFTIISMVTFGFGAICAPLFWLVTLWPAYQAYQGVYMELPVITNFMKKQGWV
jgi:uncharacterized protein